MQEKKIMDDIKAGDEQAMQKVICRYSRLLWSIVGAVLSQVGTAEDMEECVADVFIDLWEHPQKYEESRGSLKGWLSVIARNKAIDRYRQKTKIQTIPLEETVLAEMGMEPESEKEEGLRGALAKLTEEEKEILLRRYVYQQKPKEMAVALALSVKQVENRLYRIKAKMRKQMEQEG
ncbi:RNA polymerase sigma factor [Anaerotignum sp.]|uniref:RNA polymerase sigma factor n=1 Tax=Anaerotignum sp. TaxID=2039241 RepID=UPI002A911BEA|nr:sigma-70 family RNA polymerase sigma factor [Anaerotignum sp.]MCI7656774.1 sigma-70 family RNA polymerase sigma factor [Clostridia bacterium]MDY5416092.1 sigma-70 family RNA polymerase sigma factor [Anaerotignum sp.]